MFQAAQKLGGYEVVSTFSISLNLCHGQYFTLSLCLSISVSNTHTHTHTHTQTHTHRHTHTHTHTHRHTHTHTHTHKDTHSDTHTQTHTHTHRLYLCALSPGCTCPALWGVKCCGPCPVWGSLREAS